jgi:type IV pilus assembly protein PilW
MKTLLERKKEAGFSLTEMMVVLAILGVVMAAMYSMFNHQQKSYSVQDHVSTMQQNVRVGLDYLVKDIRMAGYIPEDIPFDSSDPPIPTPQTPAPSSDVVGQPFTDGVNESIEQATSTTVTFQADVDNDAVTETVTYTLTGTDLTMEVWQWNPVTTTWNPSSGPQIIARDIESLVFTYSLLADDYGVDNDLDDDGNDGADEEGELLVWDLPNGVDDDDDGFIDEDGPLNTNELRSFIRQVSIVINSRTAAKDPKYTHPTVGDHYRRRTLISNVNLRNI